MNKTQIIYDHFQNIKYNSFESMIQDFINIYNTHVVYQKNDNLKYLNFNLKTFQFIDDNCLSSIRTMFFEKLYYNEFVDNISELVKYKKDIELFFSTYLSNKSYLFNVTRKKLYNNEYLIIISIALNSDLIFNHFLLLELKYETKYHMIQLIITLSFLIINKNHNFLNFKYEFISSNKTKILFNYVNSNILKIIENYSIDFNINMNPFFKLLKDQENYWSTYDNIKNF